MRKQSKAWVILLISTLLIAPAAAASPGHTAETAVEQLTAYLVELLETLGGNEGSDDPPSDDEAGPFIDPNG